MKNEYMLEMNHVIKKFPGVVALNDVSLQLRQGEILSLCGENGAGKSTLMKVLSGEYACNTYSGSISLNGKKVAITSNKHAEMLGIAMIYQEISVELDLSVAENIMLGRIPKNRFGLLDMKEMNRIATEALHRINVDMDVTVSMRPLSASVKQLVCIARALVRDPQILILDEPTAALTEAETDHLIHVIEQLKAKGISCIYISHKLDEVFRISDRIIVMRDAQVVNAYERSAFNPSKVIEDMIGRHLDKMYPDMTMRDIGDEVLRVEHMKVQHPSSYKNIIDDVSFSVHRGEVLGLAGLVGSGRTELMRAVFGALPKLAGKVYLEGSEVHITSPKTAIDKGIGMLTEDRKKDGIVGTMNIGENMTLSILKRLSRGLALDKKFEKQSINAFFSSLNIKAPSANTGILNLSGGNQQKVVLAKSLLTDMKVLFLDEPTRGIDIGAKAEIYKIIKELSLKGLSIVMVSSEYPELVAMCDRFVVLGRGHVLGELNRAQASEKELIRMASFEK